jgi:hypothetical protein
MGGHENWFRVSALLAGVGLVVLVIARVSGAVGWVSAGELLLAPLLFLAAMALVVGVPFGLWVRYRERRK